MRCFIAIPMPDEIKEYLFSLQKQLIEDKELGITLTAVRDFHLTLKFLGEIDENKISKLSDSLKKVKFEGFKASLGKLGTFPSEKYIRVIWIGINPEERIVELQKTIDNSLNAIGFAKEKDFKAHLTLARVKNIENKEKLSAKLAKLNSLHHEGKEFIVKDFRLIKSTLTPKGPIYDDLEIFDNKIQD